MNVFLLHSWVCSRTYFPVKPLLYLHSQTDSFVLNLSAREFCTTEFICGAYSSNSNVSFQEQWALCKNIFVFLYQTSCGGEGDRQNCIINVKAFMKRASRGMKRSDIIKTHQRHAKYTQTIITGGGRERARERESLAVCRWLDRTFLQQQLLKCMNRCFKICKQYIP